MMNHIKIGLRIILSLNESTSEFSGKVGTVYTNCKQKSSENDLLVSKISTDRLKDKLDIEELQRIRLKRQKD